MAIKKPQLVTGEFYHVVVRAVGDTTIFKDENDYYRGIFSIYEFNNSSPVDIWLRRKQRKNEKILEKSLEGQTFQQLPRRDLMVEVAAFSFMPNHIHLLVKQLKDNGITQFMRKVGTGYAVYFNKKYNRKGHLFNTFKAVNIKTTEQLKNVFVYIHCNAISLIEPGWKEHGIKNVEQTIKFLENYKWHSYLDYLGSKNFSSVTTRDFFSEIMGGGNGCREAVRDWVKYKKELSDMTNIVLE